MSGVDIGAVGENVGGVLSAIGIGDGEGTCVSGIVIRGGVLGGTFAFGCVNFLSVSSAVFGVKEPFLPPSRNIEKRGSFGNEMLGIFIMAVRRCPSAVGWTFGTATSGGGVLGPCLLG